ncbi:MAG: protein-methionine-sulfoxide reductase catalytic subunit MsrP [SAR324 cluster bacterium]|nr:protein-methionine-sulfoxide reductase catalytic subunit MsrP [SAR324 cluster bacterium]
MANIHLKKQWALSDGEATPEAVFRNRRAFLKTMGVATIGTAGLAYGWEAQARSRSDLERIIRGSRPLGAARNSTYKVDRPITNELVAARYNNFYEFSTAKDDVWELVEKFKTSPWKLEVSGLVEKPQTFDVDDLIKKMPLQERVYRFRCVEAWSMVVPWTGFPLKALLERVRPLSSAKFVRFTTFFDPEVAPRQRKRLAFWTREPWPFTEGLRMDEAMNELTLLTVGMYGHVLPKQHGAPLRLITPWKYGYKSIKSIVKIELTNKQPATFWNTLAPSEYGFLSNVNPKVPHPRWSQARERVIGTRERQPTLLYNGYAQQVAGMYPKG